MSEFGWPETQAKWRKTRLSFADLLHAIAENIESRVALSDAVQALKASQDQTHE